jgi:hypothetical protein
MAAGRGLLLLHEHIDYYGTANESRDMSFADDDDDGDDNNAV